MYDIKREEEKLKKMETIQYRKHTHTHTHRHTQQELKSESAFIIQEYRYINFRAKPSVAMLGIPFYAS